ncbi:MAG: SpoIIE family protein phosphatase [Actinomycetota bacterium]
MRRPPSPVQRLFVPAGFGRSVLGLALGGGLPVLAAQAAMLEPLGQFPTVPFFVAVVAATIVGRLGAGLLAVGASTLLLDYYFVIPYRELSPATLEDALALMGFAIVALSFAAILARRDLATGVAEFERDRQEFLTRAGDVLSRTLDYETRVQDLARIVVPRLADWCAIHLLDEAGRLRVAVVAHADPEKVRWAEEIQERYPPDPDAPTGAPNVIRTGRAELYRKIPKRMLRAAARDEEHRRLIDRLGMRSGLVVPITARGRVLGAISLVSAESGRRFTEADLGLAEETAARAGLAIENARLYQERDHIAATLQRALLPPALPEVEGIELRAFYRPALEGSQVGGDFYDVFSAGDDAWLLVMGDARGKGPEAAAVTALVRYSIRSVAARERSPSRILTRVNETLLAALEGEDFATVAIVRVEPVREGVRLTASSAGHPLPAVLRRDGSVGLVGKPGLILGAFPQGDWTEAVARVARGDAFVLYTDGLTSKDEGDCMAEGSRLRRALRRVAGAEAGEVLRVIREHVTDQGEGDPQDDVAVLALRAVPLRERRQLASVMSESGTGR